METSDFSMIVRNLPTTFTERIRWRWEKNALANMQTESQRLQVDYVSIVMICADISVARVVSIILSFPVRPKIHNTF